MKTVSALLALLLCACGQDANKREAPAPTALEDGIWMADDRSGFCRSDETSAFTIHDEDGSNCMAQGAVEAGESGLAFIPRGDAECRIPITQDGDTLTFGDGGEACSYYCGGSATLTGQTLQRSTATDSRLEDIAGDPLC